MATRPILRGTVTAFSDANGLGELNWVSLADIVWVLNPAYSYQQAHPGSGQEAWQMNSLSAARSLRTWGVLGAAQRSEGWTLAHSSFPRQMVMLPWSS